MLQVLNLPFQRNLEYPLRFDIIWFAMIYSSMGNLGPYYRKDNHWFNKRTRQLLKLMDTWIKIAVQSRNEDNAGVDTAR